MIKGIIRFLAVLFLICVVVGCALEYIVKVTGYKAIEGPEIQKQVIYINERTNTPNPILEKEVAGKLMKALMVNGYQVANKVEEANLILDFDYGIDSGQMETYSSSGTKTILNIHTHKLENVGTTHVGSRTYYTRTLNLKLALAKDPVSVIWIGDIKSQGTSTDLRHVLNFLIEAGMKHFNEDTDKEVTHSFLEKEISKEKGPREEY